LCSQDIGECWGHFLKSKDVGTLSLDKAGQGVHAGLLGLFIEPDVEGQQFQLLARVQGIRGVQVLLFLLLLFDTFGKKE